MSPTYLCEVKFEQLRHTNSEFRSSVRLLQGSITALGASLICQMTYMEPMFFHEFRTPFGSECMRGWGCSWRRGLFSFGRPSFCIFGDRVESRSFSVDFGNLRMSSAKLARFCLALGPFRSNLGRNQVTPSIDASFPPFHHELHHRTYRLKPRPLDAWTSSVEGQLALFSITTFVGAIPRREHSSRVTRAASHLSLPPFSGLLQPRLSRQFQHRFVHNLGKP